MGIRLVQQLHMTVQGRASCGDQASAAAAYDKAIQGRGD